MAPGRGTLAAALAVAGAGVLRCGDEEASQAAGTADDAAAIAATINGFNGIDTVPEGGPGLVEVSCGPDGNAAGAHYLTETSDGWRLTLPFCTGA